MKNSILDVEFRRKLDEVMLKCMHSRIVLYGFDYSGRYVKWYAKYYHGIDVDFIISRDMSLSHSYEEEIFRPSVLKYSYKDIQNAVIWITEQLDQDEMIDILNCGYVLDETAFDLFHKIFEGVQVSNMSIQPLRYLEYSIGCDFVNSVSSEKFQEPLKGAYSYRSTSEKEIFPILDMCHCKPKKSDAIFDFGCGKGAAMLTFLDYGFPLVGGVEYQTDLYSILIDNRTRLKLDENSMLCIHGDAAEVCNQLDIFNWFYFFQPFDGTIMKRCLKNIIDSIQRYNREITLIVINPDAHDIFDDMGFVLFSQFTVAMRQRVVNVYKINSDLIYR